MVVDIPINCSVRLLHLVPILLSKNICQLITNTVSLSGSKMKQNEKIPLTYFTRNVVLEEDGEDQLDRSREK